MKTAHETFIETYIAINEAAASNEPYNATVEFDPEWHNGTGYFNKLATVDLGLAVGTRFTTYTGVDNARRIMGVVTPVGNFVFFERYSGGQPCVITMNYPPALAGMYPSGSQSSEVIDMAFGGPWGYGLNIGQVLSNAFKKFAN